MRKRTFAGWIVFFVKISLISLVATALGFVLFTLANFSDHASKFSFYIKTNDAEMAKRELIGLHYFYDLSRRWKVQWLADKYLFEDAPFYEVADSYLISDWGKVQNDLKEKLDDPRSYPYGNAKFRKEKAQFEKKAIKIDEALNFVMKEVAVDYEKALRNCLNSAGYSQCFDRVWNYDLVTNKKDAEEALKGQKPEPKFILGPPPNGVIPVLPKGPLPDGTEKEEKSGPANPRKRP